MDIRNIQRSGNTYYVYLPSSWCKANGIEPASKVSLETTSEGSLLISSATPENKKPSLTLHLGKYDAEVASKFLAASFLNPVKSFKVNVDGAVSPVDILNHKRLLGGIEIVGFEDNQISCESLVSTEEPDALLRTMISKLINMIHLLRTKEHTELVDLYESEIDRSNLLITKATVSALMFKRRSTLRHIDLFYVVSISKNLEKIADQLPSIKNQNAHLFEDIKNILRQLLKTIDNLSPDTAIEYVKETHLLEGKLHVAKPKHTFSQIQSYFSHISEVIVDWAVTNEVDAKRKPL